VSLDLGRTRESVVGRFTHLHCFVVFPLGRLPSFRYITLGFDISSLEFPPSHILTSAPFLEPHSELAKNGHLHEMHVCDNVGDHLQGNVYARYEWEAEASRAVQDLNTRWYAGKPLYAELSPVTDFKEACCRQNEMGECTRGG
jgi:hypothetical protein